MTTACFDFFMNFIRLFEYWFMFVKGTVCPSREIPEEPEAEAYIQNWKARWKNLLVKINDEVLENKLKRFEEKHPLYKLITLRQQAESQPDFDSAGASKFAEKSHKGGALAQLRKLFQAHRSKLVAAEGDAIDAAVVGEPPPIGEGGSRWFYVDTLTKIFLPNMHVLFVPFLKGGWHVERESRLRKVVGATPGFTAAAAEGAGGRKQKAGGGRENGPPDVKAQDLNADGEPLRCFNLTLALAYVQHKYSPLYKVSQLRIDHLTIESGWTSLSQVPLLSGIVTKTKCMAKTMNPFPETVVIAGPCSDPTLKNKRRPLFYTEPYLPRESPLSESCYHLNGKEFRKKFVAAGGVLPPSHRESQQQQQRAGRASVTAAAEGSERRVRSTENSRQQQQVEVPAVSQDGGKGGAKSGKGGRGRVKDGGRSSGKGVRSLSPPPPAGGKSGGRGGKRSSTDRGAKEGSSSSRRPSTTAAPGPAGAAGTPTTGRPKIDATMNHMQDDLYDSGSIGRGDWHDVEKRITLLITDDHRQKVHCGSPSMNG
eukprot:GHVU01026152.1.p1 GENE.GHVU01026152.1~~GHVU01026152.1.p1  ORF type:complete len:590 (+),score=103.17 GHVU01026152.1:159-1772(+)